MRLSQLLLIPLLAVPLAASAQTKSLEQLEKTAHELKASANPFQENEKRLAFTADLFKLIDSDTLKTGDEFYRASLIVNPINSTFDDNRMRHELTFVATALGNEKAAARLAYSWDQFLMATGRAQHIGTIKGMSQIEDETYVPNLTVACVRTVLLDPRKAKQDVAKLTPNKEFHDLVTEDQKVREGDWSKLTSQQMADIYKADVARRKRLKALLQDIQLLTAQDFADASLVMQHGSRFDDYALAHELALCATVLDPEKGRQLVALTWDRMLESAGYRQRIGTQYHGETLGKVDSEGFSDTMRKALGRKALKDIPLKWGGE